MWPRSRYLLLNFWDPSIFIKRLNRLELFKLRYGINGYDEKALSTEHTIAIRIRQQKPRKAEPT